MLDEIKKIHEQANELYASNRQEEAYELVKQLFLEEHTDWLLEQAEKVESLKEDNIQKNFTIEKKNIQIDDLTHELLFYSDPSNYIAIAHLSDQSRLVEDLGERARKALRRKR